MNPNTPFTGYLVAEGFLPQEDLFVVDVGASGGIDTTWRIFQSHLRAVGFDPLVTEVQRLNRENSLPKVSYEDAFVIGKENQRLLPQEVTNDKVRVHSNMSFARSSCVRGEKLANMNFQKEIFNCGQEMVYSSRRVELDEYFTGPARNEVDFIKIDTDGSDYQVLTGAHNLLETGSVLGLTVECQFHGPVHDEANLFCNIDRFLRARGFTLFDLEVYRYSKAELPQPFVGNIPAQTVAGQVQWGEAVYFRDLGDPDYERMWGRSFSLAKLLKLACLFELFNLQDCAVELILRRRTAFESVLPVERCLDLLSPPLCGQPMRYQDREREFNAWASQRQWFRFGRQRAPIAHPAPARPGQDAFDLALRMGSLLGRRGPLSQREAREAETVLQMILNSADASVTIQQLQQQGAISAAFEPVLVHYLGEAWQQGDALLAEALELICGRLKLAG